MKRGKMVRSFSEEETKIAKGMIEQRHSISMLLSRLGVKKNVFPDLVRAIGHEKVLLSYNGGIKSFSIVRGKIMISEDGDNTIYLQDFLKNNDCEQMFLRNK